MISRFNHHLVVQEKVVIKFAGHLSETFFNHHLLITMGPCLTIGQRCLVQQRITELILVNVVQIERSPHNVCVPHRGQMEPRGIPHRVR